jgi:FkbM family methyltransferase
VRASGLLGRIWSRLRERSRAGDLAERLSALAGARGEPVAAVMARFDRETLRRCPRRFSSRISRLRGARFESAGVRDGLAYVVLPGGRTLYGFVSRPSHVRQWEYVHDLMPSGLSAETFLLGMDVATRHLRNNAPGSPFALPIARGDTVLEVGAFCGHLSMWFSDQVGPEGRVVAVEMMAENVDVLRRNVRENGARNVTVIHAGAWHSSGELVLKAQGQQRNSLAQLDRFVKGRGITVRVDTLDHILERCDVSRVDVAFVTVNGAELDALSGFRRWLAKTRSIAISAPYGDHGTSNAPKCATVLREHGFRILPTRNPNLVLAVR